MPRSPTVTWEPTAIPTSTGSPSSASRLVVSTNSASWSMAYPLTITWSSVSPVPAITRCPETPTCRANVSAYRTPAGLRVTLTSPDGGMDGCFNHLDGRNDHRIDRPDHGESGTDAEKSTHAIRAAGRRDDPSGCGGHDRPGHVGGPASHSRPTGRRSHTPHHIRPDHPVRDRRPVPRTHPTARTP